MEPNEIYEKSLRSVDVLIAPAIAEVRRMLEVLRVEATDDQIKDYCRGFANQLDSGPLSSGAVEALQDCITRPQAVIDMADWLRVQG